MKEPSTTTIDSEGRLLVPEQIRQEAGWSEGMVLEIRWRDGRIEIELPARAVRIVEKGGIHVAVPNYPGEPLTQDVVDTIRESIRDRHA